VNTAINLILLIRRYEFDGRITALNVIDVLMIFVSNYLFLTCFDF